MPLFSAKEVRNIKLSSIPIEKLKKFTRDLGKDNIGSTSDIIKRIIDIPNIDSKIDTFIESMQILVEIGKTLHISSPLNFWGSKMYTHPELVAPGAF